MRGTRIGAKASSGLVLAGAATVWAVMIGTAAASGPTATGTPTTGLSDGSVVAVHGSGYTPNSTVFVIECANATDPGACAVNHLTTLTVSGTGTLSTNYTVHTGTIGDSTCTVASTTCIIAVSNQAATQKSLIPIRFGAAATPTPSTSTTTSAAPSTSVSASSSTAPVSVAAGTGGTADRSGPNDALIALVSIGGLAVVGGTVAAARRRRE